MEKKGRRTRARQRCRDLATNQTRFTHPGDNHLAVAFAEQLDGLAKIFIETIQQRSKSLNLDVQHLSGTGQNGFLVHETELPFTISSICFTAPINFSKSFNCKEFGPSLKA